MFKVVILTMSLISVSSYGQTHRTFSCNSDLTECTENGVHHEKNKLAKEDKYIQHKICIFNRIKDKEIYECKFYPGLPKFTPPAVVEVKKSVEKVVVKEKQVKKNSITAVAGIAPVGLQYVQKEGRILIKTKYGPTGGLSYLRRLDNDINMSGTMLINRTGLVGLGIDF